MCVTTGETTIPNFRSHPREILARVNSCLWTQFRSHVQTIEGLHGPAVR